MKLIALGGVLTASVAAVITGAGSVSAAPETIAPALRSPTSASGPGQVAVQHRAGRKGTRITTDRSQFGTMLFNRDRQAIYLFDKEKTSKPRCYGRCAKAWPPVLTNGRPTAGGETQPGLLGTTKRRNGTRQVTYAGQPLYYYAHEGPGQVFCHNVSEFGGLWLVVHPDGEAAD